MLILDTNAVLRYLLCDNEEMAKKVDEIIKGNQVGIKTEIVAELIYVLTGVYKIDKKIVGELIINFSQIKNVNIFDLEVVTVATTIFISENIDFVDCLLIGYYKVDNCEVFTFDKKLQKLLQNI
jgi:predicted nucleic-acid-binding protein